MLRHSTSQKLEKLKIKHNLKPDSFSCANLNKVQADPQKPLLLLASL